MGGDSFTSGQKGTKTDRTVKYYSVKNSVVTCGNQIRRWKLFVSPRGSGVALGFYHSVHGPYFNIPLLGDCRGCE